MVEGDWAVYINTDSYINKRFTDIQVTGRENGVSSAVLLADNKAGEFFTDTAPLFSTIQITVAGADGHHRHLFYGTVREHVAFASPAGYMAGLKCKGLGAALEETHCKDMFGYTSNQSGISTVEDILEDLVDNSINLSYSSVNPTGYTILKTYIPTIDAALSIPFFNMPYQTCKSVVDLICMLDTAYRDGGSAGPHYFVDFYGDLRVKTIGTQQTEIGGDGAGDWGIYYGGSNVAVSLTEGVDFLDYTLTKPTDQYANNVVLAFDLRKPAYDYWTEDSGGATLWEKDGLTSIDNVSGAGPPPLQVVGSHSLKFDPNGAVQGYGYYPKGTYPTGANANWDVASWGSERSIPTLNFYCMKHNLTTATTYVYLSTNDWGRKNNYFYTTFMDWASEADDTWYHKSIPIGPYWASAAETRQFRWSKTNTPPNNPSWSNIDTVEFAIAGGGEDGALWIDDLHFSGKLVREAADASELPPNPGKYEHQHAIMSRTPLDDTAIASDDTGMAGQLCHGELLRRVKLPQTLTCTVPLKPDLKPGEYWKVYLGKTAAGAFKVNGVDFRTLQYTHRISNEGRVTQLILTDDVLNSHSLSAVDARQVLNEYLLENNSKAMDMQGGEVDLLIPHLRKTY